MREQPLWSTAMEPCMRPVADDFAAIARRLKEIQAEVAREQAATKPRSEPEPQPDLEPCELYEDLAACV